MGTEQQPTDGRIASIRRAAPAVAHHDLNGTLPPALQSVEPTRSPEPSRSFEHIGVLALAPSVGSITPGGVAKILSVANAELVLQRFTSDEPEIRVSSFRRTNGGEGTLVEVSVSKLENKLYYEDMANGVLWPLLHGAKVGDVMPLRELGPGERHQETTYYCCDDIKAAFAAYRAVNERFAEGVLAAEPRSYFVNDYQLMEVPRFIREKYASRDETCPPISYFHHVPWPGTDSLWHTPLGEELPRAMVRGLLGSDSIGFHTREYADNFLADCERCGYKIDRGNSIVWVKDASRLRPVSVSDFPISVDPHSIRDELAVADDAFMKSALGKAFIQSPFAIPIVCASEPEYAAAGLLRRLAIEDRYARMGPAELEGCLGSALLRRMMDPDTIHLVSAERGDYTKGIPERLASLEKLLIENADLRGKVMYTMFLAPTREGLVAYQYERERIREAIDRLNGNPDLCEPGRPVVHVMMGVPHPAIMECYRNADVVLATPVKGTRGQPGLEYGDGFNLTGTELAAAAVGGNNPWLVMGSGAGSAGILRNHGAVIVPGGDVDGMAESLTRLLRAPRDSEERVRSAERYREFVASYTVREWLDDQARALDRIVALKAGGLEGKLEWRTPSYTANRIRLATGTV